MLYVRPIYIPLENISNYYDRPFRLSYLEKVVSIRLSAANKKITFLSCFPTTLVEFKNRICPYLSHLQHVFRAVSIHYQGVAVILRKPLLIYIVSAEKHEGAGFKKLVLKSSDKYTMVHETYCLDVEQ